MARSSDPEATIIADRVAGVIKLGKRLHGYGVHGSDSAGGCDILYTGDEVSWTFDLSRLKRPLPTTNFALFHLGLVLDDRDSVDENLYEGSIEAGGKTLFTGPFVDLGVVHGSPHGGQFTNWKIVPLPIGQISGNELTLTIRNQSNLSGNNEWIAVDGILLAIRPI